MTERVPPRVRAGDIRAGWDCSLSEAIETLEADGPEAEALGLEPDTARLLTLQTALGAARMALESPEPPGVLRHRVTSPGGTTERAVAVLEEAGLGAALQRAMEAARDRSEALADATTESVRS